MYADTDTDVIISFLFGGGAASYYCHRGIQLHHVLLTCIGWQGMSGGPIMSKSGVMGMTDSGGVRGTHAVHPRTILGVLKRSVGVDPQVNQFVTSISISNNLFMLFTCN